MNVDREDLRILWKQIASRHAFAYNPEYVNEGSLDALIEFARIVGGLPNLLGAKSDNSQGDGQGDTPRTDVLRQMVGKPGFKWFDVLESHERLERELESYQKAWRGNVLHIKCSVHGCQMIEERNIPNSEAVAQVMERIDRHGIAYFSKEQEDIIVAALRAYAGGE